MTTSHPQNPTIQVYNQIARDYAQKSESRLPRFQLNKFLHLIPPHSRILDAACGAGRDSAFFLRHGHKPIGIDLSAELLKQAALLHPEIETKLMDLTNLQFTPNYFDAIWSAATLLHLERIEVQNVLNKYYQILKPGGICFVSVKEGSGEKDVIEERSNFQPRKFVYYSRQEMEEYFRKAGFTIIESFTADNKTHGSKRDVVWVNIYARKPIS